MGPDVDGLNGILGEGPRTSGRERLCRIKSHSQALGALLELGHGISEIVLVDIEPPRDTAQGNTETTLGIEIGCAEDLEVIGVVVVEAAVNSCEFAVEEKSVGHGELFPLYAKFR